MSSSKRSTIIVEQLRKQQMLEALLRGKRLDGRNFDSYRDLEIEIGIIDKASGSARVKLGNTEVIAGIHVETGPPDEEAIELSRVVDRGVRESKMLNLDKLSLIPGKIVYTIFVDCSIINSDGNLLDATSYAVVAALLTCKIPVFVVQDDKVLNTGDFMPPPITTIPISVTAVKIGDSVLLDPTMEEEACMDARLTITTQSDGDFVALQKGYAGPFAISQILQSAEIARNKGEEIRSRMKGLNKTG